MAGGFIGHHIGTFLSTSLDTAGAVLLLNSFFLMGLILVTRCSLFTMAHQACRAVVYCWSHGIKPAVLACYELMRKPLYAPADDKLYHDAEQHKPLDIDIIEHCAPEIEHIKASSKVETPARSASTSSKGVSYNLSKPDEDTAKIVADYIRPSIEIFTLTKNDHQESALLTELEKSAKILQEKLERFGVQGRVVSIKRGPVVTLFEYQPAIDSKISKIIALEDDLALALQAMSIRILAPIPGKSLVGFEVANKNRKNVLIAQLIRSEEYQNGKHKLPLILGEDTIGASVIVDLTKMPHLLVAGSTGSGKSVALNTMLISLLCGCTPEQLRLILIDPKRLEFAPYADIAHLLFPIITDPKKAISALKWAVQHMEERYQKMAEAGARTINDYNELHKNNPEEQFPYLVVMIDELADLMMTAGKEIEDLITRLAQMARAAGIHLMVATQRPSVDVITGLIKVNFPSRISFRVTSKTDSRTILDASGADKLLGRGDMLFLSASEGHLKRVHGAYVSDEEIAQVVNHIQKQRTVSYLDLSSSVQENNDAIDDVDEQLMKDILQFLDEIDEVSISLLQRKFRIGYNRSARIIDALENRGFVAASSGSKTRKVIRD
ncbi:hypothetical protein Noda2021_05850 [Candidatus Dependentiae bacterium Noda2021]|nr:hypothetical protein Noda2021_05850 [Candidatus Dependentiae bacterium Noda2021]